MSMTASAAELAGPKPSDSQRQLLFWACFLALIATAFGFIVRVFLIDTGGTSSR